MNDISLQAKALIPSWNLSLFSFPDPVNDVSARLTATGVVLMAASALAFRQPWLLIILALGFIARVLTGPKLSPLGLLVTRGLTPRLPFHARYIPGPPKRFAQGIGAVVMTTAASLYFAFGLSVWAYGLTAMLVLFAALEAAFGLCVGCQIFAFLIKIKLIPERVCPECANINLRPRTPS